MPEDTVAASSMRSLALRRVVARPWVVPFLLVAVTFSVYALTACRSYTHIDAHAATVESWRIAATGNPWLEHVMTPTIASNKYIGSAPNGHIVGMRMAGPVIVGIPFYWLFNHNPARAAFSLGPGGIAAAACATAAVLLLFLAIRQRLALKAALSATLLFAFATPTWTVSANMLWTHPVTQLGIAGGAYALSRGRWWLAGTFFAVGMLGRPHVAVIAALVGLGLSVSRRSVRPAVAVGLPTVGALGVLELWNRWMFGVWSIGGAYSGRAESVIEGFHGSSEWSGRFAQVVNYLGFLVSPDRGFLVWTPLVLLLTPALVTSWRTLPDWSRWLVLGGVVYAFLQLRLNYFVGGDGFYGYRHGLELLTCLVPALAFTASGMGRTSRALLPWVAGIEVAAISLGAITESFLLPIDKVWVDNSFWLALRVRPEVVVPWLAICLVLSLWLASLARRSSTNSGSRWSPPATGSDVASERQAS